MCVPDMFVTVLCSIYFKDFPCLTYMAHLASPINLTCMSWDCGRTRFYGNLTQKGPSQDLAWPGLEPFLLWGNNVNYPTTVPLYFRSCFYVMAPSLKTSSDLCITSVLYEHHIWSLLCCFIFSLFKDSPMIFQRPANVYLQEPGQMWWKPRQCS